MIQHLLQLIKRAYLYLNLQVETLLFQISVATLDGIHNTPGKVHVIILQQNHIKESDTMVTTTTNLHGLLLQHTHTRRCLTGIQHTCLRTLQALHVLIRHRGDTTHTLHNVQHQSLRLQQRAHLTCHDHGDITFLHTRTIAHQHLHLHRGVKAAEHLFGNLHTCQNTVFLNQQMRFSHRVLRNTAQRGMVAIADILCKRQINQSVNEFIYTQHIY